MKKEYRIKLLIRRKQITEKVAKELNVSEKTVYGRIKSSNQPNTTTMENYTKAVNKILSTDYSEFFLWEKVSKEEQF